VSRAGAQRSADLRIGRFFAWLAFLWTVGGLALLFAVPPIARLSTCTSDSRPCTSWAFTAVPWWWGMLWSASLVVATLVCWPPRRWWTPQDAAGRPKLPGLFSTPEWLRGHSFIAAAANAGLLLSSFDPTAGDRLGYAVAAAVALVAVAVATACVRRTASAIQRPLHRGIAQGYDFWLFPSERRLRARHGGPPAGSALPAAARPERARRRTRTAVVWLTWCFALLCALPIAIATTVLLVARPVAEPGPFTFLLALAWVPWALTGALLITFLAGIRYPLPGRFGGLRTALLGLLALCALAAVWYLVVGTPFFGSFTWGLGILLIVQAVLAVAVLARMLIGRLAAAHLPRSPRSGTR